MADLRVVNAARRYAYLLQELRALLQGDGHLPRPRFDLVAESVRDARHDVIDSMRKALDLPGEARPSDKAYNPFEAWTVRDERKVARNAELAREWSDEERSHA